jgi:hypothetical protein
MHGNILTYFASLNILFYQPPILFYARSDVTDLARGRNRRRCEYEAIAKGRSLTMSRTLERVRKQFWQLDPADGANEILKHGLRGFPTLPILLQQMADEDTAVDNRKSGLVSGEHPSAQGESKSMSPIAPTRLDEDGETAVAAAASDRKASAAAGLGTERDSAVSTRQLTQVVEKLFEPAAQCQERLKEIALSCEAINYLTRPTRDLFQPLRNLTDHLRKLSNAFISIGELREAISILAESYEPIGILNTQIAQFEGAVQEQLAKVANTRGWTKTLRTSIAELEQSMDRVDELEAQLLELSQHFGVVSEINEQDGRRLIT